MDAPGASVPDNYIEREIGLFGAQDRPVLRKKNYDYLQSKGITSPLVCVYRDDDARQHKASEVVVWAIPEDKLADLDDLQPRPERFYLYGILIPEKEEAYLSTHDGESIGIVVPSRVEKFTFAEHEHPQAYTEGRPPHVLVPGIVTQVSDDRIVVKYQRRGETVIHISDTVEEKLESHIEEYELVRGPEVDYWPRQVGEEITLDGVLDVFDPYTVSVFNTAHTTVTPGHGHYESLAPGAHTAGMDRLEQSSAERTAHHIAVVAQANAFGDAAAVYQWCWNRNDLADINVLLGYHYPKAAFGIASWISNNHPARAKDLLDEIDQAQVVVALAERLNVLYAKSGKRPNLRDWYFVQVRSDFGEIRDILVREYPWLARWLVITMLGAQGSQRDEGQLLLAQQGTVRAVAEDLAANVDDAAAADTHLLVSDVPALAQTVWQALQQADPDAAARLLDLIGQTPGYEDTASWLALQN